MPSALGTGLFQLGLHAFAALLIAIESSASDPELVRAMLESCAQARGDGACVGVDAGATDGSQPVTWRARVIWEDEQSLRARIELRRGTGDPEHVRTVTFSAADEPLQRHRAVGLIVAAYVAERERLEGEASPAAEKPPPSTPPAPEPERPDREPEPGPVPDMDVDLDVDEAADEDEPDLPPAPRSGPHMGIDLAALAGTALDAGTPRVGLTLRAFLRPERSPLGVTLALRGARAEASSSTSLLLASGTLGGLLRALETADRRLALELRVELLAERIQARAEDRMTGLAQTGGVWRLGGQLGLEGHLEVGAGFAFFLGGDAHLLLPAVTVNVGGRDRGRAGPVGASGLLGVRWSR